MDYFCSLDLRNRILNFKRRSGRVVECTGLENQRTERYRGFESLLLRIEMSLLKSEDIFFNNYLALSILRFNSNPIKTTKLFT